jgi:hypothetical protein
MKLTVASIAFLFGATGCTIETKPANSAPPATAPAPAPAAAPAPAPVAAAPAAEPTAAPPAPVVTPAPEGSHQRPRLQAAPQ